MSTLLPLLLVAATVPILIGLRIASLPVTAGRAAAFARRHRLELTPGDHPYVVAYLSHTRRWRVSGSLGGYLVGLASTLPQERIALEFFPVLAGWFVGAVVAELRFQAPLNSGREPVGAVVPGWLLRVPLVLAAGTVGMTVIVFALDRADDQSGRILGWCTGALACAAATLVINRHVLRRLARNAEHDITAAGRAIAADAVGAITAVGSALVVWCLANQLSVLDDRFFDAAATAVKGIALLWTIGGLVMARLLATAAWRAEAADRRPIRQVLLVVAVLVATSAGWVGYSWWKDHAPFPATAVQATAAVRFTNQGRFEQDARELGIAGLGLLADQPDSQQFIGRVDHAVPAGADGRNTYHVLVIDKRRNRVAPELYDATGGGWNGFMSDLANRYDWLSATAPTVSAAGYSFTGSEVSKAADSPGPIAFVGRFPDTAGLSLSDLMVVLVLTGPDNQIYWATRISG